MEAEMNPQKPQQSQQKPQSKSDSDLRSRVMIAKNALGLKDLNVSAAVAGHKLYALHAQKNPAAQPSQILNKISPNARANYLKLGSSLPTDMLSDKIPLNQFRSTLQKLKQTQGSIKLNNSFEPIEKEQICEASFEGNEASPPPMLVLKRTGIRIFPDGRRVAMYVNTKYNLTFTIPYMGGPSPTAGLVPGVQSEETDLMESLEQVAAHASQEQPKTFAKHMKFADGSKLKVSHGAAKAIHLVHGALNDENKKKFAEMLKTPKGFEKAAHFALSKVEYTIGGK